MRGFLEKDRLWILDDKGFSRGLFSVKDLGLGIAPADIIVKRVGEEAYAIKMDTREVIAHGTNYAEVIQKALDSLTPNRTWKETVVLMGKFNLLSTITVKPYTRLVINGKLVSFGIEWDTPIILAKSHTEIIGGIIDGVNKKPIGIRIDQDSEDVLIENVRIVNCNHGVKLRPLGSSGIRRVRITGLRAENNYYGGIYIASASDTEGRYAEAMISDVFIKDCGTPDTYDAGIWIEGVYGYVQIDNAVVLNQEGSGVYLQGSGGKLYLEVNNVYVEGGVSEYAGFLIGGTDGDTRGVVTNVTVKNVGKHGVWIHSKFRGTLKNIIVEGAQSEGIHIERHPWGKFDPLILDGFIVTGTQNRMGLFITTSQADMGDLDDLIIIQNGRIYGNMQARTEPVEFGEIHTYPLGNTTFQNIVFRNVYVEPTNPNVYTVVLAGCYGVLDNCVFKKGAGRGAYIYPSNWRVIELKDGDYLSVNSGVATLPAGSTSVTVNHGLVGKPSKVLITPLGQPPGKLWVPEDSITDTSFDIVTDTAPSTDLKIAWYTEV